MHEIQVKAAARTYSVLIGDIDLRQIVDDLGPEHLIVVVDSNITGQLSDDLSKIKESGASVLEMSATEKAKELKAVAETATEVLDRGLTRRHSLLAIGGGITQDVVAFCASVCLRGVSWSFVPTTLLAQADSCIGSKTSINLGDRKNALGTYWPPELVAIDPRFLRTLDDEAMRAGVGEMLKMHAIRGPGEFDHLASSYADLFANEASIVSAIRDSLVFKRDVIEQDEYDSNQRLVMNYGHTFGHAIEVASAFDVPHGIAVSLGCDVANFVAWQLGLTTEDHYRRMHGPLVSNAGSARFSPLDRAAYMTAISKDKKHGPNDMVFVLPDADAQMRVVSLPRDTSALRLSWDYLERGCDAA